MQAKSLTSKYILVYDADCGPCTRFSHAVDFLDKYEKIDFISIINADQKGLLNKISLPLRYKSFHLILPNGEIKSGSNGLLELITILPGGRVFFPIINYFPGGKQIVRFIYNRLSRLHDKDSCSISDGHNNNDQKEDKTAEAEQG